MASVITYGYLPSHRASLPTDVYQYFTIRMFSDSACSITCTRIRYGDGAGNTVEENSSVFSLIRMR